MTQRDRDRLVVLKKAQKKLITQQQAGGELDLTTRPVRRLLRRLKKDGDKAVIHKLRGQPSNRKIDDTRREKIVRILSGEVYRGFGPTLAGEYLAKKHAIPVGREALRQIMMAAGLWRGCRRRIEPVHQWRKRRSCRGELVQWDTSTHDWLEGRGERMYLIHMIDDTDKASLFQSAPKNPRQGQGARDQPDLPPTQIGRALRELSVVWIAAHSPQAKGRVERSFQTAQDRLVKGLRVAGVTTLAQANRYLSEEFLPWWNQHLVVSPANPADAHRPLATGCDLDAVLSVVDTRQVAADYTIRFQGGVYQIARADVRPGLRGGVVRIEVRTDGSLHVRFQEKYLHVEQCQPQPKQQPALPVSRPAKRAPVQPSEAARRSISGIARRGGMPRVKPDHERRQ